LKLNPPGSKVEPAKQASRGTRVSRRYKDVEDEWQQVPEEWLSPAKGGNLGTKREEEEESELSELSDEDSVDEDIKTSRVLRLRGGAGDEEMTPLSDGRAEDQDMGDGEAKPETLEEVRKSFIRSTTSVDD